MTPLVCMLIFSMIYGGIMFMDYFNFSNQARTIAREVSLAPTKEARQTLKEEKEYEGNAGIYTVKREIDLSDEEVTVTTYFNKNGNDSMFTLVVPEEFEINYTMKLENPNSTDTESDD